MKQINNDIIENLLKDYQNNVSQHNLYLKYGISYKKIKKILNNNNIEVRKRKKHSLNEKYFQNIDSFYKAYFLGLIEADGCVSKCRPHDNHIGKFAISLQEDDGYLIDELSKQINITKRPNILLKEGNRKKQKRLSFASKEFCKYLVDLGCSSRKSFTLKFPNIPIEFIPAFILGYFDGDGSLSIHKKLKKANLHIISSVAFVNRCHKTLHDLFDVGGWVHTRQCKRGVISTLSYCGNFQILNLFHILYRHSPFFLKRKYNKFLQLIQLNPQKYITYLISIDKYWEKLWKEI